MSRNIRWRIVSILVVFVVFATVGIYPILASYCDLPAPAWLADKQLKLGLDLKGGVRLVVRVERDDALRLDTELAAEQLRGALGATRADAVTVLGPTQFRVGGLPIEWKGALPESLAQIGASFDRGGEAGGAHTFTMKSSVQQALRAEAVTQARQTVERRVNELGVAEPNIAQQGQSGDQILIELPGATDVERAKAIIGSPGVLELTLVDQGPFPTQEAARQAYNNALPADLIVLPRAGTATAGARATADTGYYVVRRAAAITGRDLRNARPAVDGNNRPVVTFSLSGGGAARFARLTERNIGRFLAIVLDQQMLSAARIDGRIADRGEIVGNFTPLEAQDLALTLRSGALPARLAYLEQGTIGASLGADAIRDGVIASAAGLALIAAFMLVYYRLAGVNAILVLIFNLVILLGLMSYIGVVMTLPGIAGFVLTMGIGVDSNVLIFERIKEELEADRGVRASINAGFSRVFLTLLDTHVSALIGALFLFQFGTGPIRGFAMTLFLGLGSNLFTSTFVSKTLFDLELMRRPQHAPGTAPSI
jgi:preprotein translocase subunit SecD